MVDKLSANHDEAGTTCLVALLSDRELTVANVGDSRGVLCDKDGNAVALSHDHKPYQLKERKRIKRAGGFISFNGSWRVQGILAMSRSLGDYPLKNLNVVIPDPDVLTFDLDKLQPEFMILASDGLWDAFSNEEAVRFVHERLDEPHYGAKSIVLQSFYRGCPDNITVMVVKFKSGPVGSKAEE
ncbi:protein phosphatase 1L-like isoform X3 [Salvelinus fontinalis]|nr:protein phosphatase 1L-like isoform X3 [Salvelinus fontinalis]